MSNIQRFENLKQIVQKVQPDFEKLASIHNAVNYKREASFALQILQKNDYTASIAMGNQDSLKSAVLNVASIGLSLSPVHKLAYLVPRKGEICLDISYLGYIQLAIEVGAIKWAHSEIVHKKDVFRLRGLGVEPLHEFDVFGDRGDIIGAYCVVKTHDGEFITAHMKIADIYSIRDRSESWKSGKASPWKTDEGEMIKKTVVRRAYKLWPKSDTRENRFEKAIDVTNQADEIDFVALPEPENDPGAAIKFEAIASALVTLNRTEEQFLKYLATVNRREIKSVSELTTLEIDAALIQLNQWLDLDAAKKAKEINTEVKNEVFAAN